MFVYEVADLAPGEDVLVLTFTVQPPVEAHSVGVIMASSTQASSSPIEVISAWNISVHVPLVIVSVVLSSI